MKVTLTMMRTRRTRPIYPEKGRSTSTTTVGVVKRRGRKRREEKEEEKEEGKEEEEEKREWRASLGKEKEVLAVVLNQA